jgi:hypothetical protein
MAWSAAPTGKSEWGSDGHGLGGTQVGRHLEPAGRLYSSGGAALHGSASQRPVGLSCIRSPRPQTRQQPALSLALPCAGSGGHTWLDDTPPTRLVLVPLRPPFIALSSLPPCSLVLPCLLLSFSCFLSFSCVFFCLSSCDHDSDKSRETLRNLTFPLSTFPRRDQTKAQARANKVGACGSAFVLTFVFPISFFLSSFTSSTFRWTVFQ